MVWRKQVVGLRLVVVLTAVALVISSNLVAGQVQASSFIQPTNYAVSYPDKGVYWGIYRSASTYAGNYQLATQQKLITDAESSIGRNFDMLRFYVAWDETPVNDFMKWSQTRGQIPMLSINATKKNGSVTKWADIASGSEDTRLQAIATNLKNFGKPMLVAFHHEPEDNVCPNNTASGCDFSKYYGTTTDYVNAWRRFKQVLTNSGVTNVDYTFISMGYWATQANDYRNEKNMYPGDDVIEWIASDPYNYITNGQAFTASKWASLKSKMQSWYNWASTKNKPLLLAEYGSLEDPTNTNHRSQWMDQARSDIKSSFPALKALLYFDSYPSREPGNDWRLFTVNQTSLTAYKNWGLDSYYNPRAAVTTTPPPAKTAMPTPLLTAPPATASKTPATSPTQAPTPTVSNDSAQTSPASGTHNSQAALANPKNSSTQPFGSMNMVHKIMFILAMASLANCCAVLLCGAFITVKKQMHFHKHA